MQNLEREIEHLPNKLLGLPSEQRRKYVERVFTEDATFEHPLVRLCGREEIYDLYQYWASINLRKVTFDVTKSAISEQKDLVVLDGWTHIRPVFAALLPTVDLRLIVFLHLVRTEEGFKIKKQEDHLLWMESLVHMIPVLGDFYTLYVRRASGLAIVYFFQLCLWLSRLGRIPVCNDKS